MNEFITVCNNLVSAGQLAGAALAAVFIIVAGFQFIAGGRNAKEIGKGTIISVCLGLGLVLLCTPLKEWFSSMLTF